MEEVSKNPDELLWNLEKKPFLKLKVTINPEEAHPGFIENKSLVLSMDGQLMRSVPINKQNVPHWFKPFFQPTLPSFFLWGVRLMP